MDNLRYEQNLPPNISLRPFTLADEAFLYELYASTRQEEMAHTGWDEAQQEAFLKMQFYAQHSYYMATFADAAFDIVLQGETPIGRLYVHRRPDELRIVDVALLPAYRGRGIGGGLLQAILVEAAAAGLAVRLHVETFNPARHLYQRLGFQEVGGTDVHRLLEWRAA